MNNVSDVLTLVMRCLPHHADTLFIKMGLCGCIMGSAKAFCRNSMCGRTLCLTDPPYGVEKANWDNYLPLDWYWLGAAENRSSPFVCRQFKHSIGGEGIARLLPARDTEKQERDAVNKILL
jgi:hypothetical protein